MTRIIAGIAGGRRLAVPRGAVDQADQRQDQGRPVLGRRRDPRARLQGARVLDLYAGSGAVGLEALSRGAADVLLIESDPGAVAGHQAEHRDGWTARCQRGPGPGRPGAAARARRRQGRAISSSPIRRTRSATTNSAQVLETLAAAGWLAAGRPRRRRARRQVGAAAVARRDTRRTGPVGMARPCSGTVAPAGTSAAAADSTTGA